MPLQNFDQLERLGQLIAKRDRQVTALLGVACGLAESQREVIQIMKQLGINPEPPTQPAQAQE